MLRELDIQAKEGGASKKKSYLCTQRALEEKDKGTGTKKKKKRKVVKKDREDSPLEFAIDPNEPTYCLCQQVSYGEMIGCDNMECKIEWFHFNCVGLTNKPKGKWYCPTCRGDRPNVKRTDK
nr:hypothetical protein BaRGS_013856 [Batillaria attramentaria]